MAEGGLSVTPRGCDFPVFGTGLVGFGKQGGMQDVGRRIRYGIRDAGWDASCRTRDAGFAVWDAGWMHCEGYGLWAAGCRVCNVRYGMQDVSQNPYQHKDARALLASLPALPCGFLVNDYSISGLTFLF